MAAQEGRFPAARTVLVGLAFDRGYRAHRCRDLGGLAEPMSGSRG